MELNTKGRYAVMAMADLAKHATSKPTTADRAGGEGQGRPPAHALARGRQGHAQPQRAPQERSGQWVEGEARRTGLRAQHQIERAEPRHLDAHSYFASRVDGQGRGPDGHSPDQGEVVCTAGCDKLPGQVVHVRENVPSSPDLAEANAATGKMPAADIGCLAGCDTAAHRFAGISSGVESSHVTTQGRFPPAAKPGSGDWLVRINRERSPEQRP